MHEIVAFQQALTARVEQCKEFLRDEIPHSQEAVRRADEVLLAARELEVSVAKCGAAEITGCDGTSGNSDGLSAVAAVDDDANVSTMVRLKARNRVPLGEILGGMVVVMISVVLKVLNYSATTGVLVTLMMMYWLHRLFVGRRRMKLSNAKQSRSYTRDEVVELELVMTQCKEALGAYRRVLGQMHMQIVPTDIVDPLRAQRISFEISSIESFLLALSVSQSFIRLFARLNHRANAGFSRISHYGPPIFASGSAASASYTHRREEASIVKSANGNGDAASTAASQSPSVTGGDGFEALNGNYDSSLETTDTGGAP